LKTDESSFQPTRLSINTSVERLAKRRFSNMGTLTTQTPEKLSIAEQLSQIRDVIDKHRHGSVKQQNLRMFKKCERLIEK
jgi:hypothetical protein